MQAATEQFKIMVSKQDKKKIKELSRLFQRSQADVIRQLVRSTYDAVTDQEPQEEPTPTREPATL
jgi:hypothetical protein